MKLITLTGGDDTEVNINASSIIFFADNVKDGVNSGAVVKLDGATEKLFVKQSAESIKHALAYLFSKNRSGCFYVCNLHDNGDE